MAVRRAIQPLRTAAIFTSRRALLGAGMRSGGRRA
eukprot:COSAG04_NODE_27714_length_280_cov_1.077348_1_plen_34_part_01